MAKVLPVVMVPVARLVPNPWNPNVMSASKFDMLADSVDDEDIGFVENLQVVPLPDGKGSNDWYGRWKETLKFESGDEMFRILGGEHRWRIARIATLEEVPCVVMERLIGDERKQKALCMRMNLLRGQVDPKKFTELWDSMAEDPEMSEEQLRTMIGIADEKEFETMYRQIRQGLPKELQEELDKMKGEIRTIDDLSLILNTLFRQYGNDLQYSFMVFDFGGRMHTWVRMRKETDTKLALIKQFCRTKKVDMNDVLLLAFDHVLYVGDKTEWPPARDEDESIEEHED